MPYCKLLCSFHAIFSAFTCFMCHILHSRQRWAPRILNIRTREWLLKGMENYPNKFFRYERVTFPFQQGYFEMFCLSFALHPPQVRVGKEREAVQDMLPYLRLGYMSDPSEMQSAISSQGPICPVSRGWLTWQTFCLSNLLIFPWFCQILPTCEVLQCYFYTWSSLHTCESFNSQSPL